MVELIVGTLPVAAFYFLLGLAFVLIYRGSKVVNFATGDLAVLAPYILLGFVGLAAPAVIWLPALGMASLLVAGLVAAGLYLLLLRPLTGFTAMPVILATFAISIVTRSLIELVWTSQPKFLLAEEGLTLVPVGWQPLRALTWADVAVVLAAVLFSGTIWALFRFTTLGVRMRAVAENQVLASYRGVSVNRTLAAVWFLGAVSAGMAGLYYALTVRLSPSVALYGLRALTIPMLGGLDSITGALVASFLVSFIERIAIRLGDPLLADVLPFVLLLIALWVRPHGLFGRSEEIHRV